MTWKAERIGETGAVWSGEDAISDMWHQTTEDRWAFAQIGAWIACGVCLIGGVAALAPLADAFTARGLGWWIRSLGFSTVVFLTVLGVVGLALSVLFGGHALLTKKPDVGIFRPWTLTATASEFVYHAGPFSAPLDPFQVSRDGSHWSVRFDGVARVEASRTIEWDSVRRYEGKPFGSRYGLANIPSVEYQVFLFMADGSRRVIHTRNSDREGAGTLAHSIRSWIEARRNDANSKLISSASSVAVIGEGYVV